MPAQREHDSETRARAIRMYQDRLAITRTSSSSRPAAQVGAMLDINPATMRNWIEREEVDCGARPGVTSMDAAEIKALRRENAELRRAKAILKSASAFLAKAEPDRPRK